jgi:hypothetical protein
MAMTMAAPGARWPQRLASERGRFRLVVGTAIAAGILICLYAGVGMPALQKRSKVKPIAAQIDRHVPESELLYALDPDFQPFLFYVHSRLVYVNRIDEIPITARYLLVLPKHEQAVRATPKWATSRAQSIERITDYRGHTIVLLRSDGGTVEP